MQDNLDASFTGFDNMDMQKKITGNFDRNSGTPQVEYNNLDDLTNMMFGKEESDSDYGSEDKDTIVELNQGESVRSSLFDSMLPRTEEYKTDQSNSPGVRESQARATL